jgi:predicted secreted protein
MNSFSIVAIYFLFWVMAAFIALPFGIRTPDETGEVKLPGQADSAPSNFRPLLVVTRATVLATILFAIYYANYNYGWVTTDTFTYRAR